MDLSFIVPVFNTPLPILNNCLLSLISWAKNNVASFEILVVDDGSRKKLSAIYKGLEKHENVYYLRSDKNRGVSFARNMGIRKACGEYLAFVDSDDVFLRNRVSTDFLKKSKYDIVIFDYVSEGFHNGFQKYEHRGSKAPGVLLQKYLLTDDTHALHAKFYKKAFLTKNEILFPENVISGEDAIFNIQALRLAGTIYYEKRPIYRYNYDIRTQDNRFAKHPQEMLTSVLYMLDFKKRIFESLFSKKKKTMISYYQYYTEQIFRCYCYLVSLGLKKLADALSSSVSSDDDYVRAKIGLRHNVQRSIILWHNTGFNFCLKFLFKYRHLKNMEGE